jgi:hypothetical protein
MVTASRKMPVICSRVHSSVIAMSGPAKMTNAINVDCHELVPMPNSECALPCTSVAARCNNTMSVPVICSFISTLTLVLERSSESLLETQQTLLRACSSSHYPCILACATSLPNSRPSTWRRRPARPSSRVGREMALATLSASRPTPIRVAEVIE